eukprot:2679114-Prymnesium_polylepis.1
MAAVRAARRQLYAELSAAAVASCGSCCAAFHGISAPTTLSPTSRSAIPARRAPGCATAPSSGRTPSCPSGLGSDATPG